VSCAGAQCLEGLAQPEQLEVVEQQGADQQHRPAEPELCLHDQHRDRLLHAPEWSSMSAWLTPASLAISRAPSAAQPSVASRRQAASRIFALVSPTSASAIKSRAAGLFERLD
jgi:hypothetical protein